jgi:hypothetical protein
VQTNSHAKKKMEKAPDWSLVFSVPRNHVTIATQFSATAFLTGAWYVSAASYTTEQLYELLPYTHKLPKSVDFILPADIWRTDDEQQVTGAPVHAAASGAASRAASGARNQAAAVAQNARGGADAVKTEQQKAVRQAIAMLESKSPHDPLQAAVKATQEAKKAVKKAQKIVLISTWARFLATIRSRQSEQKKNDFRDQRRRINRWGRVVAGLWLLLARIRTHIKLSPFWKMLRALTKSRVHWLCFIRELQENSSHVMVDVMVALHKFRGEMLLRSRTSAKHWRILQFHMMLGKRLVKMVAEHRKQVIGQNALWGFFGTRMLMHKMQEERKLSDSVLKALLRNRSTRIRKIQELAAAADARIGCVLWGYFCTRMLQNEMQEDRKVSDTVLNALLRNRSTRIRKILATATAASARATKAYAKLELEIPRCIICFDEKPNIVMLCPSNHQLLCAGCFASEFPELPPLVQIATPQLCPVCRQPFEGHLRVHLP